MDLVWRRTSTETHRAYSINGAKIFESSDNHRFTPTTIAVTWHDNRYDHEGDWSERDVTITGPRMRKDGKTGATISYTWRHSSTHGSPVYELPMPDEITEALAQISAHEGRPV